MSTDPPPSTAPDTAGPLLLSLARAAIASLWGGPPVTLAPAVPWLQAPGACFVTLTQRGQLRGCIGSLSAQRPLFDDLCANAQAAALHDRRFAPLTPNELPHTRIEVSLLSPMTPLAFDSEADALAQLRPGVDGVALTFGPHQSTFLPQVWAQLPQPDLFIAHLKQKAGLAPGFWDPGLQLQRYTVRHWVEAPQEHPA